MRDARVSETLGSTRCVFVAAFEVASTDTPRVLGALNKEPDMKLTKKKLQKIQRAARKLKAHAPDNAIFEAARLLEDGARKLRIALATPMRPISLRDPLGPTLEPLRIARKN